MILGLVGTVALPACGGGDDGKKPARKPLSTQQVVARATPTVVGITAKQGDNLAGGTGTVFDASKGLVLTNAHVVSGVTAIKVKVGDRINVPARILSQAPCDDLAVLQLVGKPAGLRAMPFGRARSLKRGERVTALGYPANFQNPEQATLSSTDGSVSNPTLRDTEIDGSLPQYPDLIQHQAPLNPGNSGGPLVNRFGELVGINTLTNTEQGGRPIQGQGYAISIDHIKEVLPDLKAGRSAANLGWDVVPLEDVDIVSIFAGDSDYASRRIGRAVLRQIRRPPRTRGLYVLGVASGSPADKAHFFFGDLISRLEGTSVNTVADMCSVLLSQPPGGTVKVRGQLINSGSKVSDIFDSYSQRVRIPKD